MKGSARPLYRHLGTWRSARDAGAGRVARPREVNGLQAHAMVRHRKEPEVVLAQSVHNLAVEHSAVRHQHDSQTDGR